MKRATLCLVACLVLIGCQSANSAAVPAGVTVPADYRIEVFATGLSGPTQMIVGPDGAIWVAQLNGEEDAGQGQIVALRGGSADKRVLLDRLLKPVGLAVLDGGVWIASGHSILRAPIEADGSIGPVENVLSDLPFNGRSIGTLTVTPDQHLIYETSGLRIGSTAAEGSAQLWQLDPNDPQHPQVIAAGLKNAYAETYDRAGRLWATDVADDPVNGGPPPDELKLIVSGGDYGWPACFGERQPATNYGGTEPRCSTTFSSVATFPPHSTPTSVVASPWEDEVLLVALWGPTNPSVVRVPLSINGGEARAQAITPFVTGLQHPQHLLALSDGSLLIDDHETGLIYRLTHR